MNYKIKELCDITSSRRIFAREYRNAGIPFFRSQEVIECSLRGYTHPTIFISLERFNEIKNKNLPVPSEGDILMSAIGANRGYPWYVDIINFYFKDGNVIWFRNFSKISNSKYLSYAFSTPEFINILQISSEHSAQGAITIDLIKNIGIDIPSMSVQQHIVNTIGSVDDLIENYQEQIDKICKILEKSLLLYPNKTTFSNYYPKIIKSGIKKFDDNKFYIDTSSINEVNNILKSEKILFTKRPSRANMQPLKNSVWFAKMKGSNKNLIITENDEDIIKNDILSTGFFGVEATKDFPLSLLVSIIISKDFQIQRDLNSVGTTMAGINNNTFEKILVPLLNTQEIINYDIKYKSFIKQLSLLRQKINCLLNLKNLLLKKYF